ncbi:hypothetical protein SAMN05660199_00741 [Klenkia soli]|uniref:Uncharacterized protein n=1 Tax=Klenkia soli TaxID=1052260 RepID=A0A1H0EGL4_9ACTN|nr:hypothetical protein [Klenkia soli]SDN81416.1 hypothetical protein SAMN05660199_00741 [Klenkia soli]
MRAALVLTGVLLLAACGETVDGFASPVPACPDGSDPGELVDGATLEVGGCVLLEGYDVPTNRLGGTESSDESVLARDGADRRLFTGQAPGDAVVTVSSYSADCSGGQSCAMPNDDVELSVTVTG